MVKESGLDRFKKKWNLRSNMQVLIIIIVFSITGSLSVFIGRPILKYFEVRPDTMNAFLYWTLRIGIIFPVYQVMLLLVGAVFGQFNFFWNFQKKFFGRFMG